MCGCMARVMTFFLLKIFACSISKSSRVKESSGNIRLSMLALIASRAAGRHAVTDDEQADWSLLLSCCWGTGGPPGVCCRRQQRAAPLPPAAYDIAVCLINYYFGGF